MRLRNRGRARAVPAAVLTAQLATWERERAALADEGFDAVLAPVRDTTSPPTWSMLPSPPAAHERNP